VTVSHWQRLYSAEIDAAPATLFDLLADLPNYSRWLAPSSQYGATTEVEPYPVALGSRYHDGKPDGAGRDWWGTVTAFDSPSALAFEQQIPVRPLAATVDARIRYSIEAAASRTLVTRLLELDIRMPAVLRPLRGVIISEFDKENVRTLAALKAYAEGSSTT
jgi:uncharacterized protein YndB with AHSA1/START domain